MAEVTTVRAAGGVVWRPDPEGGPEPRLAVVHRPRYDDWSLPKGKLRPDEHPLVGAVREVFEETSARAVPQTRLPSVRYRMNGSRVEKVVTYWTMRTTSWSERRADHEVDAVRWIGPAEALALLSYGADRELVRDFAARPMVTGLVALVRHARAGERKRWAGPDHARPLDAKGRAGARAFVPVLAVLCPARIMSASPVRCVQTMLPLAAATRLDVEPDVRFDEGADPRTAAEAVRALGRAPVPTVVCSQGRLIPPLLAALTGRPDKEFHTRKGDGWLLAFAGSRLASAEPIGPEV